MILEAEAKEGSRGLSNISVRVYIYTHTQTMNHDLIFLSLPSTSFDKKKKLIAKL